MHGYRVMATVFVGGAVMQLPVFPVGRSIRKAPFLVERTVVTSLGKVTFLGSPSQEGQCGAA